MGLKGISWKDSVEMFVNAIQKCCSTLACTSSLAAGTASYPGSHLQSDSLSFDQCHSIDACLKTKVCPVYYYSIFDDVATIDSTAVQISSLSES